MGPKWISGSRKLWWKRSPSLMIGLGTQMGWIRDFFRFWGRETDWNPPDEDAANWDSSLSISLSFLKWRERVHYDLYHVHPVDIHSILSGRRTGEVENGFYEKEYPLLTALIREVRNPKFSFSQLFSMNIGKGTEGNHSLMGAEIGMRIGIRDGAFGRRKGMGLET